MHDVQDTAEVCREPARMTAKIYAIMAVTTVLTFGTLVISYQLLFPPQPLFA